MPPLPSPEPDTVPKALIEGLERHGFAVADAPWHKLSGGRTNRCWRVCLRDRTLVVKLFGRGDANPLFPNDPSAEAVVLSHLSGQDIAPDLIGHVATDAGECVVYRHVEGATWRSGASDVARLLARVHALGAVPSLRRAPDGSRAIEAQTCDILRLCPDASAEPLRHRQPRGFIPPGGRARLLHGDPVPGNIIGTGPHMRLIDWQCPAIGDPCEDIAMFLSPAMQIAYRGAILSPQATRSFLGSYPSADIVHRYRALAPWYHWRMAAYCTWLGLRGDPSASQAIAAEIAALTGNSA